MIDIGFGKIALIGVVALIVIGPQKLPMVARTVGNFFGRAQRYIAEVRTEVSRQMEFEELRQAKQSFESATEDINKTIHEEVNEARSTFQKDWDRSVNAYSTTETASADEAIAATSIPAPETYTRPRKRKHQQNAVPLWYRRQARLKRSALTGAARMQRYRP